jgi:LmbE family N-acetylglucosaminyl deacetylase
MITLPCGATERPRVTSLDATLAGKRDPRPLSLWGNGNMELVGQRFLALAPHTDDAELGCGGTIARLIETGAEVHVAAFSTADVSLPPGSPSGLLKDEYYASMRSIGIPSDRIHLYFYETRRFSYQRQEILEDLVALRRKVEPEMVFLPSSFDTHQDHQVIYQEGVRAFLRNASLWGYEASRNCISFTAQGFFRLELHHLQAKWNALQLYRSQFELGRSTFSWDVIQANARVRGLQVNTEFAEAFEVIRQQF